MDNQTNDKRTKWRKRREQMADNSDSIFWMPFSGTPGYTLKKMLIDIDKAVTRKRRRASTETTIQDARAALQSVDESAREIWELVVEVVPRLHAVPYDKSTLELNNTRDEKRQMSKIPYSIGFLPNSPETGLVAMAVKKLEERGIELQKRDLNMLPFFLERYSKTYEIVESLQNKLNGNGRDK